MTLIMVKNNDANALYQRVQELERQIQTKDGELQKETDRALQQAEEIRGILQQIQEVQRRDQCSQWDGPGTSRRS
ncbi:hypothetical protein E4U09_005831, partial [Claviceps aff. purpurea]